jgi:hypothetical protein
MNVAAFVCLKKPSFSLFFFFWGGTEIYTQSFALAKQSLYHLSHTSSTFCCGVLEMESCELIALVGLELNPPDLSLPTR